MYHNSSWKVGVSSVRVADFTEQTIQGYSMVVKKRL